VSHRLRRAALVLAAALAWASAARGRSDGRADELAAAVAQAASISGLPAAWIQRVIAAESGGHRFAVSRAGARGLMQLMPPTWAELRARLGLGDDPFDVRDNVVAGAVYLREMFDRFGPSGFLAAYNAGPGRYAAAAAEPARLPSETLAYVAGLAPALGAPAAGDRRDIEDRARASGLFVRLENVRP